MSFVRNAVESIFGGSDAAEASYRAGERQSEAQTQALNFLREVDEPLIGMRNEALPMLGGFFGLGGGTQQDIINQVTSSPFYDFNREAMEESILRNASATGGLRSGNVQRALAESTTDMTQDLVNQQLRGLQFFASPNLSTNQQAQVMQNIGTTNAGAILGAEQGRQSAFGQGLSLLTSGADAAASAGWI